MPTDEERLGTLEARAAQTLEIASRHAPEHADQGRDPITARGRNVLLPVIGSPTYTHVEHLNTLFHSAGWFSGGTISDAGGATVDVTAGTGAIRATDSAVAQLLFFDWSASNGLAITSNSIRYVGVEYNAGSPQVVVRTTDNFDDTTAFLLGTVVNEGGTLHVQNAPWKIGDHASAMIQRSRGTAPIARDKVVGGLIFSETGTRNVAVSAGALWHGLTSFTIGAIDTDPGGAADTFATYSAGGQEATGVAAWPNAQYDNAGTLTNLTPNRWANLWWYLELDTELVMVYGTAQYTSAALAGEEAPPSTLPNRLQVHGVLAARFIFQEGAGTAEEILSAFDTPFSVLGVTDHGNLAGVTAADHHAGDKIADATDEYVEVKANIVEFGADINTHRFMGTSLNFVNLVDGVMFGFDATKMTVELNLDVNGVIAIGAAAIEPITPGGAAGTAINVSQLVTPISGTSRVFRANFQYGPGAAGLTAYGLDATIFTTGASDIANIYGMNFSTQHQGSGTLSNLYGGRFGASTGGTGDINWLFGNKIDLSLTHAATFQFAFGQRIQIAIAGGVTVPEMYGIDITFEGSFTSTISNLYQLSLNSVPSGSGANVYAIRQADANDVAISWHQSPFQFGGTVPTSVGNGTSQVEVLSTTKDLLPPRMTTAQVATWLGTTPQSGGMVYDTGRDVMRYNELVNGAQRALSMRSNWYNVMDFGAVGDGSTDDRAAIQAAIDAADADSGGVVYFPANTYKTIVALNGKSGVWLVGDGYDSVIRLDPAGNGTPLDCLLFEDANAWGYLGLRLQAGAIWTNAAPAGSALHIKNCRQFFVQDIWIDGVTQADRWKYGYYVDDDVGPALASRHGVVDGFNISHISGVAGSTAFKQRVAPGGWGFYYAHGTGQTQKDIGDVAFSPEGDIGLWMNATDGTHFHDVEFIDFEECLLCDSTGGVAGNFGNSNSKFVSSSFESEGPAAGRGGKIVATNSSLSFEGVNFYGGVGANSVGLEIDADVNSAVNDLSFTDCRAQGTLEDVQLRNTSAGVDHGPWMFSNFEFQQNGPDIQANVNKLRLIAVNCWAEGRVRSWFNSDELGNGALISDDFVSGSVTSGQIGALGWLVDGGTTIIEIDPTDGHVGAIVRDTGASINTRTRTFLPIRGAFDIIPFLDIDDWFEETFVIKMGQTADVDVRIGLFQVADTGAGAGDDPPAVGVYFERLGAEANWSAVCRTGAAETKTGTGKTFDTSWHKLTIRRKKPGGGANGTMQFIVDDDEANATDVSAHIPTNVRVGPMVYMENTAAAAKYIVIDKFVLWSPHLSRY